jgi:hypothetical protein
VAEFMQRAIAECEADSNGIIFTYLSRHPWTKVQSQAITLKNNPLNAAEPAPLLVISFDIDVAYVRHDILRRSLHAIHDEVVFG